MEMYRSWLPKTGPISQIIVLDVQYDLKNHTGDDELGRSLAANDVLTTLTCFQGLINRQTDKKVFLINMPVRLMWKQERDGDLANLCELLLDLLPYPKTRARLDMDRKYPALSWLLRYYSDIPKGKVLWPEVGNPMKSGGARASALNVCTFEGALPVTREIDAYLAQEGIRLDTVADTQELGYLEGFKWSLERFIDHPKRNRQIIGLVERL